MYTRSPEAQDGVNLGTADRAIRWTDRSAASNLDTLLDRGVGRRVRMLLSFQRPSHLFKRGFLLRGTPGSPTGFPGWTHEYSAAIASWEDALRRPARVYGVLAQDDWRHGADRPTPAGEWRFTSGGRRRNTNPGKRKEPGGESVPGRRVARACRGAGWRERAGAPGGESAPGRRVARARRGAEWRERAGAPSGENTPGRRVARTRRGAEWREHAGAPSGENAPGRRVARTDGGADRGARSEQHLDRDGPRPRPVVEVDQHDLLPGPEREAPVDQWDRLRRADQRRAYVRV